MSFTVVLPLLAGGLAGYAGKKTEKSYFYEQATAGGLGYTASLLRIMGNAQMASYVKGGIPAIFLIPAALIGGSLYAGRQVGEVCYDALT